MPATAPITDTTVLSALRNGDEQALERLFHERFVPMLESATATLGEPARAARAVERAFLDLWDARAQFDAPERLEDFLHAAFQDAVAVQRGRAASLRRFESREAVVTRAATVAPEVEASWDRVTAALKPGGTTQTLASMRAESRHHTAEHLAAIGRRRTAPLAVVGVVLLALAAAAFLIWFPRGGPAGSIDRALTAPSARQVTTENGQRGTVKLGDGTTVSLGARSALTIAEGFGTQLRAVRLVGTATFEPVVNQEMPFVVQVRDFLLTATGTTFDVAVPAGERTVTLRVRSGTVNVTTGQVSQTVVAGSAVVIADGSVAEASPTAVAEALGWVDGEIVIAGRTLGDALPILQRWYGLTLTVDQTSLLERPLTMRASVDSMRAAIRELQRGASVIVDYDGKKNLVWDAAGPRR